MNKATAQTIIGNGFSGNESLRESDVRSLVTMIIEIAKRNNQEPFIYSKQLNGRTNLLQHFDHCRLSFLNLQML